MGTIRLIEHDRDFLGWQLLTPEKNFLWRESRHAFWYLLPGEIVLSITWMPGMHRGNSLSTIDDIRRFQAWNAYDAARAREEYDEKERPCSLSVDSVVETVRTNGGDSVEFWAWRRGADGGAHQDLLPSDYGWVTADAVGRAIALLLAHPDTDGKDLQRLLDLRGVLCPD